MIAMWGLVGLSPRLRGNQVVRLQLRGELGSIPAPAGEPKTPCLYDSQSAVYPRACGGTIRQLSSPRIFIGLSPRLRGNRQHRPALHRRRGSIPTPAGEPHPAPFSSPKAPVYPRACGGTHQTGVCYTAPKGLSPRLRGNLVEPPAKQEAGGSIPAPAEEPSRWSRTSTRTRVYPRACGGTELFAGPVGAGDAPVYPRACGGTVVSITTSNNDTGLSPRLRGNLPRQGRHSAAHGSIPAPAGEPQIYPICQKVPRVYPRAGGGTSGLSPHSLDSVGLSPRLRGNQDSRHQYRGTVGSIPAPAGEPQVQAGLSDGLRVYPRACGGTDAAQSLREYLEGLSPRLRGNLEDFSVSVQYEGSIPAPAGEPSGESQWVQRYGGLSPRLRGNLAQRLSASTDGRSIPAPAGEPPSRIHKLNWPEVYPHACGGTRCVGWLRENGRGLSPRLRGNLCMRSHIKMNRRSIPAPAGEPPPPPR